MCACCNPSCSSSVCDFVHHAAIVQSCTSSVCDCVHAAIVKSCTIVCDCVHAAMNHQCTGSYAILYPFYPTSSVRVIDYYALY